jgi:hypothetical protein
MLKSSGALGNSVAKAMNSAKAPTSPEKLAARHGPSAANSSGLIR